MWKSIAISAAISAILALSSQVLAKETSFTIINGDQCVAELNYWISVGPDFMEVRSDKDATDTLFIYRVPDQLSVDGNQVFLDKQQQALMQRYRSELHGVGHDVTQISLDAVELALQGVSIAMTTLAGPDHPDSLELERASADIRQRVEDRFSTSRDIYFLMEPEVGEYMEEVISEELGPKIEKLVEGSAGSLVLHGLKAAFTGGHSIERRAEAIEEEIEAEMENRGEDLEQRAEQLCNQLENLDNIEREVQKSIPALEFYNIVEIE